MDAVGYGSYRDFLPWPARKQGLEDLSAYLSVQLADAIDLSAAPYREISHVERFRVVFRVLSSQSEHIVHRDREFIDRIVAQVRANECGIKAIETGTDGGMCSEKDSRLA